MLQAHKMLHRLRRVRADVVPAALLLAAGLLCASGLGAAGALRAQEQVINGFSAWQGEGKVYKTGPDSGTFVGAIKGALFIQTEKGPVAAGRMVCPAVLEIDLRDATQMGEGKCIVTGDDGAEVFAEWSCRGVHLVGCDGAFKITGGTGRMSGITGQATLSVRSLTQLATATVSAGGALAETVEGILTLDNLEYRIPQQ